MEKITLQTISKHMKGKKVIGNSHHGFVKGKSCFSNLITFYKEMTSLLDEGKAADAVYLSFSKADPITCS